MENFENLIVQFKELNNDFQKRRTTFMAISGYPHYENVCSNILAFLFDSDAEHGFSNLWLRALMNCYPNNDNSENSDIRSESIEREFPTSKGGRLDLLIQTNKYVIGIENKIYSTVTNNLEDYANTIEKTYKDCDSNCDNKCILLTLRDESNKAKNGFINITYKQLFEEVKSLMGEYIDKANNTWLIYIKDFIYEIEGLIGNMENTIDKNFFKFYDNNEKEIIDFMDSINSMKNGLKKLRDSLCRYFDNNDLKLYKTYNYTTYFSVYFDLEDTAIEVFPNSNGWHITVLRRDQCQIDENKFLDIVRNALNKEPESLKNCCGHLDKQNKYQIALIEDLNKLDEVAIETKKYLKLYKEAISNLKK